MSVLNENTIIGASAASDYEIEQSLRFDDGRTTYLSRTNSAAGNRKTYTLSAWIKFGEVAAFQYIAGAPSASGNNQEYIQFGTTSGSTIRMFQAVPSVNVATTALLRDTSAWYHVVFKVDTTQSTAANRVKIYINGVDQLLSATTYPAQNANTNWNTTAISGLGSRGDGDGYYDGYLAEVNFIDGQALTPDSFGETGKYGEWNPIKYAGTYGTNGFYLPFKQDYTVEGFSTVTYDGTGTTQYIGGTGFSPSWSWFKRRSGADTSTAYDVVRGVTKALSPNNSDAEGTIANTLTAFNADGFTLGSAGQVNANNQTYVAWNWDMGGTTASNTNGAITSSVRANQAYGQSIVSYSGASNATSDSSNNGGSYWTIGHGLAQAPEVVLVKTRSGAASWYMGHQGLGSTPWASGSHLQLIGNEANANEANILWGNAAPTSTVFKVGGWNVVNRANSTYIAYCFHSVTGYSKFSSYSGNGSTTGPVITLGFSPAFLMVKCSSTTEPWTIVDNTRNPTNPLRSTLVANTTAAEADMSAGTGIDFTSTGFQVKTNIGNYNTSGQTYIYMAFADTREYAYWLDQSGNNNDWTSESGLTESDVMVDSPTNNFAVFNPLIKGGADALSEGNLKSVGTSSGKSYRPSTIGVDSGKFYFEGVITIGTAGAIGVCIEGGSLADSMGKDDFSWSYHTGGTARHNNSNASYGASYTTNDIIGVAVDIDNGTIVFFKNGASQGSYSIVGHSASYTYLFGAGDSTTGSVTGWVLNFGSDSSFAGSKTPQGNSDANGIGDFFYQPPSGFLALCTKSLPSVDVIPSENFNTVLYTGTASPATHTLGFRPNLIWGKRRSATQNHWLINDVGNINKRMSSDNNESEQPESNGTTFNSTGFTTANNDLFINNNSTYVVWGWKGNGTGSASSNSNGSITSQVSVNAAAGFSIVTYTGTGSNATVGHGLSKAPNMSWIKPRNFNDNWIVTYDAVDGSDDQAYLNLSNAGGSPASQYTVSQNATTLGLTSWNNVNDANDTYVAYCFHSVYGYSKVGKYVGNGNADGVYVHCGFSPAFIITKSIGGTGWRMIDNKRTSFNPSKASLYPDSTDGEYTGSGHETDFTANGFKMRNSNSRLNTNNQTYIFLAFAENPFKHSNAR